MAFNKLLRPVRKLKRNQVTSILTRSQMGLNAFQSPMHEWGREKIVIGKNTCCNLSLLSCFPHCPGAHCHFVSITRKDPAGAIDSREHPSIQLNKQREGKGRQSITVAPLNGWVYWLTYVFSCCQAGKCCGDLRPQTGPGESLLCQSFPRTALLLGR